LPVLAEVRFPLQVLRTEGRASLGIDKELAASRARGILRPVHLFPTRRLLIRPPPEEEGGRSPISELAPVPGEDEILPTPGARGIALEPQKVRDLPDDSGRRARNCAFDFPGPLFNQVTGAHDEHPVSVLQVEIPKGGPHQSLPRPHLPDEKSE